MPLLALDFDGVISDSARESFVVAIRAHASLDPRSPLAGREDDAGVQDAFLERMPLGNRAEDYAVALESIRRGVELADQASYDAFKSSLEPRTLRAFHRRFYEIRSDWARSDPAGWLGQMRAYPGLCALLRRRAADLPLAIASSKDARSVRRLLEHYGIADLFPADRVLDKEAGEHKRAHITCLARRCGLSPREITFVDDKVNHLLDVAPTGARCALAAWGYNGPREWREARAAGFAVVDLEGVEAALFPGR